MRHAGAACWLAPMPLSCPAAALIVIRRLSMAHSSMLQVASQSFLSDAALEATLNNRADFAGILADLGFVSPAYAAHCNSANAMEDSYGQDVMSGNARVIKAAICAGEYSPLTSIEAVPTLHPKHSNAQSSMTGSTPDRTCAGFYPSILRVDHPPKVYRKVLAGAMETDASPASLKFFDRTKGERSSQKVLP